jgi:hypothetical protein
MLLSAILAFVGMFFSVKIVSAIYFIAIILSLVLYILDKKYGTLLTNYKLTYMLFELVNLIAVISIVYYEFANHSEVLNLFLILLICLEVLMLIIDIFVIKNRNLTKRENLVIDFFKLCSMVCILTYFFNVSKLYFSIFAFVFEAIVLVFKVYCNLEDKPHVEEKAEEEIIEDVIHLNSEEGDKD